MFLVIYGNMNKHFNQIKESIHKYFDIKDPLKNYQLIINSKYETAAKKFKEKLQSIKKVEKIKYIIIHFFQKVSK